MQMLKPSKIPGVLKLWRWYCAAGHERAKSRLEQSEFHSGEVDHRESAGERGAIQQGERLSAIVQASAKNSGQPSRRRRAITRPKSRRMGPHRHAATRRQEPQRWISQRKIKFLHGTTGVEEVGAQQRLLAVLTRAAGDVTDLAGEAQELAVGVAVGELGAGEVVLERGVREDAARSRGSAPSGPPGCSGASAGPPIPISSTGSRSTAPTRASSMWRSTAAGSTR